MDCGSGFGLLESLKSHKPGPLGFRLLGFDDTDQVGLNQTRGLTVIMVTHEADMAEFANRTLHFVDGKIKSETLRDAA